MLVIIVRYDKNSFIDRINNKDISPRDLSDMSTGARSSILGYFPNGTRLFIDSKYYKKEYNLWVPSGYSVINGIPVRKTPINSSEMSIMISRHRVKSISYF